MHYTVTRQDSERRGWRAAAALAVVAVATAGGVGAAPWINPDVGAAPAGQYALRIELPAPEKVTAVPAVPEAAPDAAIEAVEPPESLPAEAAAPGALAPAAPVTLAAAAPSLPAEQRVAPRSRVRGVMALRFSLAEGGRAGETIELDKPISFGGSDVGRIPLRIEGGAQVFALGSRLSAIIAAQSGEAAVPAGLSQDFVSLEKLRALGIAVRYDPVGDRLVIDPPAA